MSDYLATVERFFVILRRRGLALSPKDAALVRDWAEVGIPVETVCTGLVAGAERFRELNGDEAPLPSTIHYYRSFVEDSVAASRAEPAASAPPPPRTAAGDSADPLAELAWIGQHETDARRREAYRAAWRALQAVGDEADPDLATRTADTVAIDTFVALLSDDERATLDTEVERVLAPERGALGVRGRMLRERAVLEEAVRSKYRLVKLSEHHDR